RTPRSAHRRDRPDRRTRTARRGNVAHPQQPKSHKEIAMNIQDSTVLVTGANRGIGKAFADALLDRGATKVYAAVRDVATVTDPRLLPIQLDVTDPDRVAAVARELD